MAVFDTKAIDYDQWYESKMGRFVDEVETNLAFSMFVPQKGMTILDVGCGTGNFSIKLAELGCKVVAIDLSEEMLKVARRKVEEKELDITFHTMDVYDIKLEENQFDAVFSMAAFEFIKEPQKAYTEMMRVLKPGGELLIGTIHRNSSWGSLYMSKDFQENTVFKYADFKSLEELEGLDKKNLVARGECLFIPPDTPEEGITMEKEKELSHTEGGGFICALWKKPV
ncbi:ubiquinone biosynthesis O-methyltransferase [Natronincola peptidivorans]|uniref:Ubiquinone biosynthesis O-methyltransferase n=1 Tax=Natronincola peptidivorans TaxID=426128 RepID=A0A1I0A8G7_9FIRM|nr:class I SAM-dependent methyltransferase [Natronincola peptidivorans]SES89992.1 ubiquinone biosynthesis O-methyltransferase [Natronincola peptidivorans]